jgi:hypothetical protein
MFLNFPRLVDVVARLIVDVLATAGLVASVCELPLTKLKYFLISNTNMRI